MSDPDVTIDRPRVAAGIKAFRGVAVAFAATVLLMLAGFVGWRFFSESQLGWIELTNDGQPLTAQVFSETGEEPLGEPFHLISRSTLALPDGDYRLRVNGVGRLGRTYRFAVNRGETQTHAVSLEEGRLLGAEPMPPSPGQERPREAPMPFAATTVALELASGKSDLIEWTGQTLIRRDGLSGKIVWDAARPFIPRPIPEEDPAARLRRMMHIGRLLDPVQPTPDLDGDGIGDLIWSSAYMTSFLALSGRDGSVLWESTPALSGEEEARSRDAELPGPVRAVERPVSLVGTPSMTDLDRDGTPDLIATLIFTEVPLETDRRSPSPPGAPAAFRPNQPALGRRMIQAISGRSGRSLWSYPIDRTFAAASYPAWMRTAMPVIGRNTATVAYVNDSEWIGLDPATGRRRGQPIDLGFVPIRTLQYSDLDGDGEPDILALGPGQAARRQTLSTFATTTGRELWTTPINALYENPFDQSRPPEWPLVVDLDGDGRSEIAVPDSGPQPPGNGYRGVRFIDGLSGRTRWVRPMRPETQGGDGLIQALDAPDLDHDGVRDLVTTSFFLGRYPTSNREGKPPVPERVYVDALSGKDGHPLWWWHQDTPTDGLTPVWPLRWWGRGPDGWPLLAVPLGGPYSFGGLGSSLNDPPIVFALEASTGRQVHAAVGLNRVGVADLDGDGLSDLWGEVEGQLRAFRGEAPEAWRALGSYHTAQDVTRRPISVHTPAADLDGDGIADTLVAGPTAPNPSPNEPIGNRALGPFRTQGFARLGPPGGQTVGSRTVIARSGRDGHVIWKTELDPRRIWFERDHGEFYSLATHPQTRGDLDGDGTPDVIVQQFVRPQSPQWIRRPATLPLRALSGRTGRHLWSAGLLPLGFEAYGYSSIEWIEAVDVESKGTPDLLVRHNAPFVDPGSAALPPNAPALPRLARVSGRDGRILWDVLLSEHPEMNQVGVAPLPGFGDLDGDGGLDAVAVLRGSPGSKRPDHELRAVSLRESKILWSLRLDFQNAFMTWPQLEVADLDGDKRPEIIVSEQPAAGSTSKFAIKALDGRNGEALWAWNEEPSTDPRNQGYASLQIARFDGDAKSSVCLGYSRGNDVHRILTLDARGNQAARLELPQDANMFVNIADINGDGRDELVLIYGERIHALDRDMKELWSTPAKNVQIATIFAASPGRSGTVVIAPALGLDGSNGHRRWVGQAPHFWGYGPFQPGFLDPGDSSRLPLLISNGLGATVCRSALPTDSDGIDHSVRGEAVPPGLARDDPRWIRPLPWARLIADYVAPTSLIAVTGLALLNLVLPLGILRLAARRRVWSVGVLMALPVAAAVPLTAFVLLQPVIPVLADPFPSSPRILYTIGTLVGIPLVALPVLAVWSLMTRRWVRLAWLAGLTIVASLGIAGAWLWADMRAMPAIEHYSWSGWYLIVLFGAYAVGLLSAIAWAARSSFRLFARPRRPEPGPVPVGPA